jgi:hypothetical protein
MSPFLISNPLSLPQFPYLLTCGFTFFKRSLLLLPRFRPRRPSPSDFFPSEGVREGAVVMVGGIETTT